MHGANYSKTKYEESILDNQEHWHEIKNGRLHLIVSPCISSIFSTIFSLTNSLSCTWGNQNVHLC